MFTGAGMLLTRTTYFHDSAGDIGGIYSESIRGSDQRKRVKEKSCNIIYTVNIYQTKSSLLINGPQMAKVYIRSYTSSSAMGSRK